MAQVSKKMSVFFFHTTFPLSIENIIFIIIIIIIIIIIKTYVWNPLITKSFFSNENVKSIYLLLT